ncbi:MAG: MFS transporter [Cyclobacteriaceae bacterium]
MQVSNKTKSLYSKITWRILPVLFVCYILAYIDRVNVGFAKLEMSEELWFNDAVFTLGSGIFFIGYFIFEVPGNLWMHRIGARIWITRIMVTWGICSALCALSTTSTHFYFFRFLLGVAEAGFFPSVILYLTYWYPRQYRARIYAGFMMAVAFAGVFGSLLSGWLLDASTDFAFGKPWQWLFILEGVPSVVVGLMLPFLLTDRPAQASWLSESEKTQLAADLANSPEQTTETISHWTQSFKSPVLWLCTFIYFSFVMGLYGISFWLPQILQNTFSAGNTRVGMLTAIPWFCAALGMVIFGWSSDRSGDRKWHLTGAGLIGLIAFYFAGSIIGQPWLTLVFICLATTAVMCSVSVFWSVPSSLLAGTAAAAGLAWINSVANLGGFLSPEMFNWLKAGYGLGAGLKATGIFLGLGSMAVLLLFKVAKQKI